MLFQVGYLHQLAQLPSVVGNQMYLAALYELAKPYGTPNVSSLPMDVAGGLIVETLLGPALVGGSWGNSGHGKFFFTLRQLS